MAYLDGNNNLVLDQSYDYDILGLIPGSTIKVEVLQSDNGPGQWSLYIYQTDEELVYLDSTVFNLDGADSVRVTANAGEGNIVVVSISYFSEEAPDLYSQQAIVPAAVSSQLDESGEERIHIAPYQEVEVAGPTPPETPGLQFYGPDGDGGGSGYIRIPMLTLESSSKGVCTNTSYDLVNNAESLVIVGYAPTNAESSYSCGAPVPTEFEPVNIPMVYDYNSFDDYYEWSHSFDSEEELPTNGEYYVKALVNGETEIVGIVYRGSGV